MNINDTKRFYKEDTKKYIIKNNKDFISYIYDIVLHGYTSFASLDDYQSLIDNIVKWYEIKYPDAQIMCYERGYDGYRIKPLDKYMSIEQLMYRLKKNEADVLKCYYRGKGSALKNVYDNNGVKIGYEPIIYLQINKRNKEGVSNNFLIHANSITGFIEHTNDLVKIINNNSVSLKQLYDVLKSNYSKRLEFDELKKCIYNYDCDGTLRKKLLELASLEMLYSKNTTPEIGYERAKKFISEFNDKFKINLTTHEIDKIMNVDYSKNSFNRYVDDFKDKCNSKIKNNKL